MNRRIEKQSLHARVRLDERVVMIARARKPTISSVLLVLVGIHGFEKGVRP